MTLGPGPGIQEDFGAVRSTATPSGDAPDGAAASGGATPGLFDDLVDAWLAPAADEDDADAPADGVPVPAAVASLFSISLPLPVIAPPPLAQADVTDSTDASDSTDGACPNACDAASTGTSQPPVDRAPQASPEMAIDPAPTPRAEGEAAGQSAQHGAPSGSAPVEVAKVSEAVAADEPVRNAQELPGLRSHAPSLRPAAREPLKNDAIDHAAPAKASSQATPAPAPTPSAPEPAAPSTSAATPASSSPAVESELRSPVPASDAGVEAPDIVNATTRSESAKSPGVAALKPAPAPAPHEAARPHKVLEKPNDPQAAGDIPRKASVGLPKIEQPAVAAEKLAKAQGRQSSEVIALEIDTVSASASEDSVAPDVALADAPRRSSNPQLPREQLTPPAIEAAAVQASAPQVHARSIVPNENSHTTEAPNLDDPKPVDGPRGSRNVPAPLPDQQGRREASEERDRDANRDTSRDSWNHTESASRAGVSQPFVERAEFGESPASQSQPARASVTLVHGTAPVLTQATLVQPPIVASSDAPATATPAPDTADRIVQSLRLQVQRGGGDAVLHLEPDHLGPVAISLRVENGSVSAVITAEHPAVVEWLQSNQQSLRDGLQASGLTLERFVVQRDGQSPSDRQRREWVESRRRDFRRRQPQTDSTFEISM